MKNNFQKVPTTSSLLQETFLDVKDPSIPTGQNRVHRHTTNTHFKTNTYLLLCSESKIILKVHKNFPIDSSSFRIFNIFPRVTEKY